jgi:hypothetical protein
MGAQKEFSWKTYALAEVLTWGFVMVVLAVTHRRLSPIPLPLVVAVAAAFGFGLSHFVKVLLRRRSKRDGRPEG